MADNKCDTASCGGNCDSCDGNITVTLTPVSYTHLDVYKRQPQGRCS